MVMKPAVESTLTWNKDLKVGDTIEGIFEKEEVYQGQYGESKKYIIVTKDGQKHGVYGTASLDRQFNNVPEGVLVKITYKGEVSSKSGRPVKNFLVEFDDEVTSL